MRLIDADKLRIFLDRQYHNCHGYMGNKKEIYKEALRAVKSYVHSEPEVDAVEVVHGHWDEKADCSVCGMPAPTDDRIDFINIAELNYCPYCGAKMDEVSE